MSVGGVGAGWQATSVLAAMLLLVPTLSTQGFDYHCLRRFSPCWNVTNSGVKTFKNLESEWERAGNVAIGAELLQRYYNLRYEKSHYAAIHTIIDSIFRRCLQSHDIPLLAIIPGLALCCKIYADQGLNFDTHHEAIDKRSRELSRIDDFASREFKVCVEMDIHSICTDLQKHARR
jgi:hypothetical protein